MKNLFTSCIFLCLFWSCQEIENGPMLLENETNLQEKTIDPDLIQFLNYLGYQDHLKVSIIDEGKDYLIDNEIIVHKSDVEKFTSLSKSPNFLWRKNFYTSSTPFQKRNIPYIIYDDFSQNFRGVINDAFDTWNNIRNFNINFYEVDKNYVGDVVYVFKSTSSTIANANRPWASGEFGDNILLNQTRLLNEYSSSQVKWIIVHSIGHLLGIGHETDGGHQDYSLVAGTFDNYFTMYEKSLSAYNSSGGIPSWSGFFYTDLLGIRNLWPHDTSEKPLYTYMSSNSGWAYLTPYWGELEYGNSNYGYWGVTGYIYTSFKSGTIPIYRYTHSSGTPYISTTSNLQILYPSYTNNGVFGYVFSSGGTGRIPVYEWYNPNVGYYFTTNSNDGYVQSQGWIGGGIAFYALSLLEQ